MIQISVESLCNGGLVERIAEEIQRVVQNIQDPNTPAEKARKVKMEMTVKPAAARDVATVTLSTSSTLCPPEPLQTSIFLGVDPRTGEAAASEVGKGESHLQKLLPGVQPETAFTKASFTVLPVDRKAASAGM